MSRIKATAQGEQATSSGRLNTVNLLTFQPEQAAQDSTGADTRRSTWDTPRFLCSYDETLDGDLVLLHCLLDLLTDLVDSAESTCKIDDIRVNDERQQFTWTTELRHDQTAALQQVLAQDTGSLNAHPCSGKTVMASAAIDPVR